MHQHEYASEVLKRFEMINCNPALTPCEPRFQLTKDSEEKEVDATEFRKLIGSLRYLCNRRPNIVYSVGKVNRYIERPKISHLVAAKKILGTSRKLWIMTLSFHHLTREDGSIWLVTLTLTGVVTRMIESLLLGIFF
jgi:hypothetical protein